MFSTDDDAEETDLSATRYPCMPSLVALQQMNNRLHLAYTGKKLMKWTAMATGREMRKLARELHKIYATFREEMRHGYILLARARYCNGYFNDIVLENVQPQADVKMEMHYKSISGAKTTIVTIIDTGIDSYAHLGVGRGGENIAHAKEHWCNMLKKLLYIYGLRKTFVDLEKAHLSATKRQNVLGRVVVPRALASVAYIYAELEEMAREEFYRIKKILANKYKKKKSSERQAKDMKNNMLCIICGNPIPGTFADEAELPSSPTTDNRQFGDIATSSQLAMQYMCDDCIARMKESDHKDVTTDQEVKETEPMKVSGKKLVTMKDDELQHSEISFTIEEHETIQKIRPGSNNMDVQSVTTIKSSKRNIEVLELGTFEVDTEEITKIVRTKNEDGTITEQKKIIRRKKERRAPLQDSSQQQPSTSSSKSSVSNKSKDTKTVGLVTLSTPKFWKYIRRAQSLNFPSPRPQANTIEKHCKSLAEFIDGINLNYFFTYDSNHSMCENMQPLRLVPSNESEEFIQLHDIQDNERFNSLSSAKNVRSSNSDSMLEYIKFNQ